MGAYGITGLYPRGGIKARKPRTQEVIGLGRNCAVFEQARVYAYAEWRRLKFADRRRLLAAVYDYGMNVNNSFRIPMLDREVLCIARSISRWTARHIDAQGLREWGDPRR
jgi:hypothetical protein